MPSSSPRRYYWDSNVFLSYIVAHPDRVAAIDDLWDDISQSPGDRVFSSAISIVEVACAATERDGKQLDPQMEIRLDDMWRDPAIELVEVIRLIAFGARKLIREAVPKGWVLKPYDAVHLATAVWVHRYVSPIAEFHTYDKPLTKYHSLTGIAVCEPHILQPKLL